MKIGKTWEFASLVDGTTRKVTRLEFSGLKDKIKAIAKLIRVYSESPESPLFREYAQHVLQECDVRPRDYPNIIKCLCDHVRQFWYMGERVETFIDPGLLLRTGKYSDCDDLTMCLGVLLTVMRIPCKLVVLSWYGEPRHIFLKAGYPLDKPTIWIPCETTRELPYDVDPKDYAERMLSGNASTGFTG